MGPVGGQTDRYKRWADQIAVAARDAGMAVCKVYTPYADDETVKVAARGADLFVALMHGSGFPKPLRPADPDDTDGTANPRDVESAGRKATDAHIANYFKASGVGETMAERINPALRDRVQSLRTRIGQRRATLLRQTVRAVEADSAAEDAAGLAQRAQELADNAAGRAEAARARRPDRTIIDSEDDILIVSPWLFLVAIVISATTGYVTLRLYVRL